MTGRPETLFVLTGAGVSAESGLGTFRDRGGLWARFDPMKLATPEAYAADPDTVLDFYDHRRRGWSRPCPMPPTTPWSGPRHGSPNGAAVCSCARRTSTTSTSARARGR